LLRREADGLVNLSPLRDGAGPLAKRIASSSADVEAAAIAAAGAFAEGRDYRARETLAVARAIQGLPWLLIHKIDRDEAMGAAETRLHRLFMVIVLSIAFVVLTVIAIWRHAVSRRAAEAADRFEALARRFEHQSRLLHLVTDTQPASIFIADADGVVRFANKIAAATAAAHPSDVVGKTLAAVFGPTEARRYERQVREALAQRTTQSAIHRADEEGRPRIVHGEFVPLPPSPETGEAVLAVEVEITPAIVERERRERTLRQVVRTLVELVDRRDPFAADHSHRVAAVARRIAEEMGLDPVMVETAEIAGSLMNLGKILVPTQILTRSGAITADERQRIRESLKAGADLLEGVEFDGPVVDTLRQAQEHWDGSGPRGVKGVEILVTARIIAVANAFVALASERAHRPGVELDQAVETIMREAGTLYDRRVVAALLNDLENRGGKRRWADFAAVRPGARTAASA
jgi:HD-GYP domain-containing protein (c-di-GMP phosphodiesterase class II)